MHDHELWQYRELATEHLVLTNGDTLLVFPWPADSSGELSVHPAILHIKKSWSCNNIFCFTSQGEFKWRIGAGSLKNPDPFVPPLELRQDGTLLAVTQGGYRFLVDMQSGYLDFVEMLATGGDQR